MLYAHQKTQAWALGVSKVCFLLALVLPWHATAIYLADFGRGRLANGVRFVVDLLNGVPTIIFGLFAWVLIVVPQQTFSGLSGGVALGLIMIPIVARTAEDVLRLVPRELREASLALGATETRTIVRVVWPAARGGLFLQVKGASLESTRRSCRLRRPTVRQA